MGQPKAYLTFVVDTTINGGSMKRRWWTGDVIKELQPNQVFLFGSNPEGRHGAGAAKAAMKFGAKYGVGRGLQGQTYALVTKNLTAGFLEPSTGIWYDKQGYRSVSWEMIQKNILELYECAVDNEDKLFIITYQNKGKNLNGYSPTDMFDLFMSVEPQPKNIIFHKSFKDYWERNYGNIKQS